MSTSSASAAAVLSLPLSTVASDSVTVARTVVKKFESVAQMDGEGASVRRSIGRRELPSLDPFLMLDEFNVSAPGGFPPHPHRGQSTVTYMISGKFEHEDFKGHKGIIAPGDLQWMTAGKGICHSEVPVGKEPGRGLQLWVNLPKKHKLVEPDYQELLSKDIPKVSHEGFIATVIAGRAFGVESPVRTAYTPTAYLDFSGEPNAVLRQSITPGWNSFIYVIEGSAVFGASGAAVPAAAQSSNSSTAATSTATGEVIDKGTAAAAITGGTPSDAHHTLVLSNSGKEDGIIVKAGPKGVRFVLISGQPINEPVVQHGPFVMSSRAEIEQAFTDYQMGEGGFEGALAFSEAWEEKH